MKHVDEEKEWKKAAKEGPFTGHKFDIEKAFNDVLYSVFHKETILIPMHHAKHHHFSLPIIDNVKMEFRHMNPMRPLNKEINKHWSMIDAVDVVSI